MPKAYAKLRGRIVEKFGTVTAFAEAIGLSRVSVTNKLSEKTGFSQEDITKWCEALEIELDEIGCYFF